MVFFHHFDPFIIHLTGNIGLRWYSMAYIAGFLVGYYLVYHWLVKTRTTCLSQKDWGDQVIWSAFGMILGGRIGYALFYQWSLFTTWDFSFPFWGLLKIHEGGLASHGG